ncbi:MAG: hypothetical protein LBR88_03025 [Zoogloeaceae bacterium]|jgi:hypothetical protein|nr:hypothetical protein [Zoogloeaceae bacterium]
MTRRGDYHIAVRLAMTMWKNLFPSRSTHDMAANVYLIQDNSRSRVGRLFILRIYFFQATGSAA